jgi:hypothetical protein
MITTPKGYEYPEEDDSVTLYPAVAQNNALLEDERPGLSAVDTATRDGYSGPDLWNGRVIWNTDTEELEEYNTGTSSWGPAVAGVSLSGSVAGPETFGESPSAGSASSASRGDHHHGALDPTSLINSLIAIETARAEGVEGTLMPKANKNAIFTSPIEASNIIPTALTGTVPIYVTTNPTDNVYTSNASGDWVWNIASTSTQTLNALLAVGQSITLAFDVPQGATPYYCTNIEIDGTIQTVAWLGGTAPTTGNPSGHDVYIVKITKTAASTYVVLASLTQF